eukprot:m.11660 g.11660  ORF g.11660 m.11660 type:complete len:497 (+) comp6549_c0_seq1:106-1596(+)
MTLALILFSWAVCCAAQQIRTESGTVVVTADCNRDVLFVYGSAACPGATASGVTAQALVSNIAAAQSDAAAAQATVSSTVASLQSSTSSALQTSASTLTSSLLAASSSLATMISSAVSTEQTRAMGEESSLAAQLSDVASSLQAVQSVHSSQLSTGAMAQASTAAVTTALSSALSATASSIATSLSQQASHISRAQDTADSNFNLIVDLTDTVAGLGANQSLHLNTTQALNELVNTLTTELTTESSRRIVAVTGLEGEISATGVSVATAFSRLDSLSTALSSAQDSTLGTATSNLNSVRTQLETSIGGLNTSFTQALSSLQSSTAQSLQSAVNNVLNLDTLKVVSNSSCSALGWTAVGGFCKAPTASCSSTALAYVPALKYCHGLQARLCSAQELAAASPANGCSGNVWSTTPCAHGRVSVRNTATGAVSCVSKTASSATTALAQCCADAVVSFSVSNGGTATHAPRLRNSLSTYLYLSLSLSVAVSHLPLSLPLS